MLANIPVLSEQTRPLPALSQSLDHVEVAVMLAHREG